MKYVATILFLIMISRWCAAQSKIGVVIFPQISALTNQNIKHDTVNKNMLTFSWGAGVTYTKYLSKKISVQAGLLYSCQNQKIHSTYKSKDGTMSIEHIAKKRFDYLKVPVLFRYSFHLREKLNLVPFAGLQLSYLLKYDGGMIVYSDNYFDTPPTPPGNNFYKKALLDIPLGFTVEYALSPRTELILGGKFDYALTNAANKNAAYLGSGITSYGGVSSQTQHQITYGLNAGISFILNKKEKSSPSSQKAPMLADHPATSPHTHHHKKDTVILEGKHHHRHHSTASSAKDNPVASSSRDHVGDVFNKSYTSMIKGVVYRKGTFEILNNTKIILETEEGKIDSSITAIGGMYTLHVQNRTASHQMYVYKKGYKPLLIDIPDTLLDRHQVSVVKIQLEPDGSNHQDELVTVILKGKVINASTSLPIPGALVVLKNNVDKTTRQVFCDANGNYSAQLKNYSHYTVSAAEGNCTSEKINKSTLSIKESTTMEMDLKIICP